MPPADSGHPNTTVLSENLAAVRRRIERACARVGRSPDDVRLVAVTKSVDVAAARALVALGCRDLGENRVPSLVEKAATLRDAAPSDTSPSDAAPIWHMIGHLQRNKLRRCLDHAAMIHAGDRLRLLQAIDTEVQRRGSAPLPVLLQVNVSGEASKGGFSAEELPAAAAAAAKLPGVRIEGLMTMAPAGDDPESARPIFARLRTMRDELASSGYLEGAQLSMGMSADFDVAVEEGATMVRVGRILFAEEGKR